MLVITAYHQNKSYSKSIRQYAKEGLKLYFYQLTYLLLLLNIIRELYYITKMSRGCHLIAQCQKHAKISGDKVQFTYIYKITFLILLTLTFGIL